MTRRLLAVHAHPDDESSKGAATAAHYRSLGYEVMVVTCTGGERGDVLNDELVDRAMADRDMAGHRRFEMEHARQLLDIQHRWLGYMDSGLPPEGELLPANSFATIPVEHAGEPLTRIIREFRPHVVVTYDENGGYPHPDHIQTHLISMFAVDAAADADRFPEQGPTWQVAKVYYDRGFNAGRMSALADGLRADDPESHLLDEIDRMLTRFAARPDTATTHVRCGDFFPVRDDALRAHASQVPASSSFFFWPMQLQQTVWPYEDYELVSTRVHTEIPEDDLFAGIPDDYDTTAGTSAPTTSQAAAGRNEEAAE